MTARFNNTPDNGVSRRFVAKNLSQVFGVNYDQKIPRQARPIIQRKESDKMHGSVSPPGGVTSEASPSPTDFSHLGGSEFRDRVQTAPTILRRQRKNTQVMVENNNTEDSLDEHVEMPKPHQETKKGQKHRFPFKKNREKQETKDEIKSRRRIRADGQLTPGRGGADYSSQNNNEGTTLRARSASTSTTERRRRTRRRRGNRKSGSNTGLDGDQIEKMSLEEALSVMQSNSREGQTWKQGENLQCQVINGTTYFTPVGNYKTKESNEMPVSNSYEGYSQWSPGSNEKGQSMNDVSLYDGGDTGLSFPEFKPRQFTKSEPAQRRNLKTGVSNAWNGDFSGESELKSRMSDIKSLWNAKERQKQVQDEPELAMMASTAQEAATLALIENDSKVENLSKINKTKICKLWESKEANSTDMWEAEKPISTRLSPTAKEESIWSPPVNEMSSLRINPFGESHRKAHLGIEAPSGSDPGEAHGIWTPISANWNPIPS